MKSRSERRCGLWSVVMLSTLSVRQSAVRSSVWLDDLVEYTKNSIQVLSASRGQGKPPVVAESQQHQSDKRNVLERARSNTPKQQEEDQRNDHDRSTHEQLCMID